MIKYSKLAAVSILFVSQGFAQGMPNYDIAKHCHELAAGSYSLEETCRNSEQNDKEAVRRATVSPEIWRHCVDLIKSSESYGLLRTCIRSEEGAKASLGPSSSTVITVPEPGTRAGNKSH